MLFDFSLFSPLLSSPVLGPAQVGGSVQVLGTVLTLAVFFSLTAHIAARNVLGDVPVRNALGIGPLLAVVAVSLTALGVPPALTILLALAIDAAAIYRLYGVDRRYTLFVTFIHVVVSIILGVVLFAALTLAFLGPPEGP
jgi:hypothetical protein